MDRKMPKSPLTEFRKPLLDRVGGLLVRHGFSPKPKGQRFDRPLLAGGRASLHLSFIPHGQFDFHVTGDVAVRFDAVEDLVTELQVPASQRKQTVTLGSELGNIRDRVPRRWAVTEEDDLPTVANSIVEMFEAVGLPYLERYSNPEEALKILSRNDSEGWRHMPAHDVRCKSAVALAHLLGKHRLKDDLIRQSKQFLSSRSDFEFRSFVEFLDRLRKSAVSAANN